MGSLFEQTDPSWLALAFSLAMLGAWGIGWWRGRRAMPEPGEDPGIKFTDASLALLGLLLAFTFSLSLARHEERRGMVTTESNAIGDFYTCAGLLKGPTGSRLQGVIRAYARHKLAAARHLSAEGDLETKIREFQKMHARMTTIVAEALGEGTPIALALTNTLNNVTSTHASRLAAYRARLPWSIVLLLFLGAIIPAFLMGLKQATSPRPHLSGTVCFIFMVTLVIYVTLDLNQPGSGTIRVSQEPFERLLQSMEQ
ncbi:MAG TPA: hypothetical protein VEL76_19065 [Gemmataceae bacterium]|nr:hypothetical protein [Gemmataceae bacterium]